MAPEARIDLVPFTEATMRNLQWIWRDYEPRTRPEDDHGNDRGVLPLTLYMEDIQDREGV